MNAGVILAAGAAERLGRPKQLLSLRGRPLLQHVVDAAAAGGLSPIVIVLGHRAAEVTGALALPPGARIVKNADYAQGQASSLRCGLAALEPEVRTAVILLGDQPRLAPSTIRAALDLFACRGGPVVRTVYRGQPGHPVVLGREVWEAVMAAEGDHGARDLLAQHREWVVPLERDEPAPVDVDTADDYELLRQQGESAGS